MAIVAVYYAIGGLPAIMWISFMQSMLVAPVLLYGGLISAGGGLAHLGSDSCHCTEHGGPQVPWQKTLGLAFSISLGLLALPDLLIMLFSARDRRVVALRASMGPSPSPSMRCVYLSLGVLAYGAFSSERLAPFMTNPDGLVPFLATSMLPPGFDSVCVGRHLCSHVHHERHVLVTTTSLTSDILRYLRPATTDGKVLLLTRVVGVMIMLIAGLGGNVRR